MSLGSDPESSTATSKEDLSRLKLAAHEAVSQLTVDYMRALALRHAQDSAAFALAKPDWVKPPKPVFKLGQITK